MFHRCVLPPSSGWWVRCYFISVIMEALSISEMFVCFYETTWHRIPEDCHLGLILDTIYEKTVTLTDTWCRLWDCMAQYPRRLSPWLILDTICETTWHSIPDVCETTWLSIPEDCCLDWYLLPWECEISQSWTVC
jgi:hypothetical protein